MKVLALEFGFFNGSRIRKGQEFEVPAGTKASWFTPVDSEAAKAAKETKAKEAKAPKKEQKALSEMGKEEAKSFNQANEKADLA